MFRVLDTPGKIGPNDLIECPQHRGRTMSKAAAGRNMEASGCELCEMCSGAKSEAFCRQCTDFICSDCVELHGVLKVFAGHNVVTLRSKKLKDSFAQLAKIQTDISAATKEVEKVEREISEQHKVAAGTIEQSFKQLHETLRKRERELLIKVSELKEQKLDILGAQKMGFALATSEIQGLMGFVERSVKNTTEEEFTSLQQHIQEQTQEMCNKHERIGLIPVEVANIGVRVACVEGIADLCQKNAEVVVLPAGPTIFKAEGRGTKVAEVGKSAHFTVRTEYQNGQLCEEIQLIEAELKSIVMNSVIHATVTSTGRGVYEVTYTPEVRGRHTLIIKVKGTQIAGSPFQVFARIHPTQLGTPVRVVRGVCYPWGIALNSKQQFIVAEWGEKRVTVFDRKGTKVQTITCENFSHPNGVAVDKDDNIYVSDKSHSTIFKFTKEGVLMKVAGREGTQAGEFSGLGIVKIINDKLYVCDRGNNRVQILNTNLEYLNSFGCHGNGDGQFDWPSDIAQDGAGNLYVTDSDNNRVQVFDDNEHFSSTFSARHGASAPLNRPRGICVGFDQFVYVCDHWNECVSVFKTSGEFVTSIGRRFRYPGGIAIDDDGFVYVNNHESFGTVSIL